MAYLVGYLFSTSHLYGSGLAMSSLHKNFVFWVCFVNMEQDLLGSKVVGGAQSTETQSDGPCELEVELALGVLLVRTVSHGGGGQGPQDIVADENWVVLVLVELARVLLQAGLSLLGFCGRVFLELVGLLLCLGRFGAGGGFGFLLQPLCLGLGLDGLFFKVRLDALHLR